MQQPPMQQPPMQVLPRRPHRARRSAMPHARAPIPSPCSRSSRALSTLCSPHPPARALCAAMRAHSSAPRRMLR
eukprot:2316112-Rhodomonas_salina.2